MKISLSLELEFALLMLVDPYVDYDIPSEIGDVIIAASKNCLAFQVPDFVERPASVVIESRSSLTDPPDFSASLEATNCTLALQDSNRHSWLLIPLKKREVEVQVWMVNNDRSSCHLLISDVDVF